MTSFVAIKTPPHWGVFSLGPGILVRLPLVAGSLLSTVLAALVLGLRAISGPMPILPATWALTGWSVLSSPANGHGTGL